MPKTDDISEPTRIICNEVDKIMAIGNKAQQRLLGKFLKGLGKKILKVS